MRGDGGGEKGGGGGGADLQNVLWDREFDTINLCQQLQSCKYKQFMMMQCKSKLQSCRELLR